MTTTGIQHTAATLLRRAYANHAGRPAFVNRDGSDVTYAQLHDLVARVAGGLAELGSSRGDRVVLALRNSEEFVVLDHALLWGGYVRVAVSYRLHPLEIAKIAQDASATAIVIDPDIVDAVTRSLAEIGFVTHVIESVGASGQLTVAQLGRATPIPPVDSSPSDLAWMPYTSGTTGNPKGVMHTHASILATMRNMMAEFPPATDTDTVLQAAPMSHLAGWVGLVYAIRGARQVFLSDFDAEAALRAIQKYGVTVTPVVPTIVALMTEEAERGSYDISSLETVIYAGSPMAPDKVARAIKVFGSVFVQCYGLTELPMPLTALSKSDHQLLGDGSVPKKLGSAGRVSPFIEIRVVDDQGNVLTDGSDGEIQVRGDQTLAGYWQLPEESLLREGGWFASGDIGRFEDGFLYIVDRKRDLIVSGGFNIFPSEIEAVIAQIEGVADVAVVGIPDPKWGETVLAVVVVAEGAELADETILARCRESVAGYKQPRRIEMVEQLPRNTLGKLLRRELRARYWNGFDRNVGG